MIRRIAMVAAGVMFLGGNAFGEAKRVDFALHQADGNKVFKLSEVKGKYVALHFLLKTTCPYCIKHTHDVTRRAGEMPDVVQIFIKPDTEEEIEKWSVRLGKKFEKGEDAHLPVIYRDPDAQLAKRFDIPFGYKFHGELVHYPALILLGPGGNEVFRYAGENNGDRFSFDQLKAKVAEVKKAKKKGDGE